MTQSLCSGRKNRFQIVQRAAQRDAEMMTKSLEQIDLGSPGPQFCGAVWIVSWGLADNFQDLGGEVLWAVSGSFQSFQFELQVPPGWLSWSMETPFGGPKVIQNEPQSKMLMESENRALAAARALSEHGWRLRKRRF